MSQKNYITKPGFETLKQELVELRDKERPKLVEIVAWAASNGDRSENGDYLYGKKRLREIDRRIRFLIKRMESAEVIIPKDVRSESIVFGATVKVAYEDERVKRLQIVGEDEILAAEGKISWKSPIAKSLLGKKKGDFVIVKLPKGEQELEILNIQYV